MRKVYRVYLVWLAVAAIFCIFVAPFANAITVNFTYDDAGRLVQVEYENVTVITYTYDNVGNMLSRTVEEIDSDSDGLPDSLEQSTCTDPLDADTDDDGILDGLEDANQNGEFDPGETHPCKVDTDGDGIQDGTELGYTLNDIGADTDTGVFQADLDPASKTDPLDPDSDGDGVNDGDEDSNHNGRVDPRETAPTKNSVIYVESEGICSDKSPCYSSIQEAVDDVSTSIIIKIAEGSYDEHIGLNTSKTLIFQGGWNSTFTSHSSTSSVNSMTIRKGTVIVDKLLIQ